MKMRISVDNKVGLLLPVAKITQQPFTTFKRILLDDHAKLHFTCPTPTFPSTNQSEFALV